MAVIVRGSVPAEEFALNHTLASLPEIEIECERIVQSGEEKIMPLLWLRHPDRAAVDEALSEDPTVASVECLSAFEDEYLFQMEWVDHVHLLIQMIANGQATILDAYGWSVRWHLRVLYPDREHLSATHGFAEDHGLSFDIHSLRELEGEPAGRYGLTDSQYRALVLAARRGYFEVPREATLEDLADELGVSHQSLSGQLRRALGALVEDTLLIGEAFDESDD